MAKNNFYDVITDKRTVPYSTSLMGTITTVGKEVIGSNKLTYDTLVGAFVVGKTVTDTISGATAKIIADNGTILTLANINGLFSNNDTLTSTGATALVNGTPDYTRLGINCQIGDWIVDLSQNEIRKIVSIGDIHSATIESAFTVNLPASTALVVVKRSPQPKEISVLIPNGNPNGQIDGKALAAGVGYDVSKMGRSMSSSSGIDFVDPIIVDASGTTATININY